jgi:hypothetical protein
MTVRPLTRPRNKSRALYRQIHANQSFSFSRHIFDNALESAGSFIRKCRCLGFRMPLSQAYTERVARGWESKSVEAQQSEAAAESTSPRLKMSPEQAARFREKENLRLARRRILQQFEASDNPRHRKILETALADLDERLRKLD